MQAIKLQEWRQAINLIGRELFERKLAGFDFVKLKEPDIIAKLILVV